MKKTAGSAFVRTYATAARRLLALLTAGLLAGACGGGSDPSPGQPPPPPPPAGPQVSASATLRPGVVVLEAATTAAITASTAQSVTFAGAPAAVTALAAGDIFIAQGVARRVVAQAAQGGATVVTTSAPTFSEVFLTLRVAANGPLTEAQRITPGPAVTAPGVRVSALPVGRRFAMQIDNALVKGQVVLENPEIELQLNYGAAEPPFAHVRFIARETADLMLAFPEVSGGSSVDLRLLSFDVQIPLSFGTVTAGVTVYLRIAADGSARVVAGLRQAVGIDARMTATLDPFAITSASTVTRTADVIAPQFDGAVSASLAIVPQYEIQVLQYAVAGLTTSIGLRGAAKAGANQNNGCLRARFDVELAGDGYVMLPKAALQASFGWDSFTGSFDVSMQKVTKELFRQTFNLYDSGDQCLASNQPPVARAGADVEVAPGTAVPLDGLTSSDADGAIASHQWLQVSGPAVILNDTGTATPSFIAPATPGPLVFRLTVTDDRGATASDEVMVTVVVAPPPEEPPAAPAGVVAEAGNATVTLTWNTVVGATRYHVYRATVSGVTAVNYATLAGGTRLADVTSPLQIDGLANDTNYFFVVTAANGAGESAPSAEVTARPAAPSVAPPGVRHRTIAAGTYRVCVIVGAGAVKCWFNTFSDTPVFIDGIVDAEQIVGYSDNFCALLRADGSIRCWGSNGNGQLGNGTFTASTTPQVVTGITGAVAVDIALTHGCALLGDGSARCWGNNTFGQLGTGAAGLPSPVPVEVLGVTNASDIAVGHGFTCVVAGGAVRCVGSSQYGTLGNGTAGFQSTVFVTARDVAGAAGVYGTADRACAVASGGGAWCWGANNVGQLGNGTTGSQSNVPVAVSNLSDAASLAASDSHSCAVTGGGAVRCWGWNFSGQLGNGTNTDANTPVDVTGVAGAVAAAGGAEFTCAVIDDGTVKCWGMVRGIRNTAPVTIDGITDAR